MVQAVAPADRACDVVAMIWRRLAQTVLFAWLCFMALVGDWWGMVGLAAVEVSVVMLWWVARDTIRRDDAKRKAARS